MPDTHKMALHTTDLAEAVNAVGRIYCPHEVGLRGRSRDLSVTLKVARGGDQPVVNLRYSTPVRIEAGDFQHLMLVQTSIDGSGTAVQANARAAWVRGRTLLLSPGLDTQLEFDGRFAQQTVRLNIERLETLCSRWLNNALDRPLRFELRLFAPELEMAWTEAVSLILKYEQLGIALPKAAAMSLDEFMLSLVLALHPHNYSDDLRRQSGVAAPRIVREAEYLMRSGAAETSVSKIAAQVGVSLR